MGTNLPSPNLGTNRTISKLRLGSQYSCALLDNATVKCWGWAIGGSLGYGNQTDLGDNANEMGDNLAAIDFGTNRTVTDLSTGDGFNCRYPR